MSEHATQAVVREEASLPARPIMGRVYYLGPDGENLLYSTGRMFGWSGSICDTAIDCRGRMLLLSWMLMKQTCIKELLCRGRRCLDYVRDR